MKKKIYSLVLIVLLILIAVVVIVRPFRKSDLEQWRNDVSKERYLEALDLIESNMDNPRYTYFDFLEDVDLNYDLPSNNEATVVDGVSDGEGGIAARLFSGEEAVFNVNVSEAGYYQLDSEYKITGEILNNITISILINEDEEIDDELEYQFDDAKTIDVPLIWEDISKDFSVDSYGDQSLPNQRKIVEWRKLELYNNTYTTNTPLVFYLEAGDNEIKIENVSTGELSIRNLVANPPVEIPSYEDYISNYSTEASSFNLFVNATKYTEKNSSYVRLQAFMNPSVSPYDNEYKKLNVLDGSAWYRSGQEVTYTFEVEEDGLYDLTLHFANFKSDFQTFRSIKIDGEIPFEEFGNYSFDYTPSKWENETLKDENGENFQVYLEAGMEHTISFRAEKERVSEHLRNIQLLIDHINQFALEIIEITGKDIDRNRTWRLTNYIPNTQLYLEAYRDISKYMVVDLAQYSEKEDLSSALSYLKKAVFEYERMLEIPDELPLYLANLYSGSGSTTLLLGNTVESLNDQQLYLDGFYVSNDGVYGKANANIFERTGNSLTGFFNSFTSDKYNIENSDDVVDVWVNRPLTYVDIMQKMVDSTYTQETGVKVKISVMPDPNKLILANSAGNTPDVALGLASYMPFDLAIRGALYDLTEFDDYWEVANRFAPGALVPYVLDDGVYAMPETLDFSALVYRKDVFNALELEVPDTWDDVIGILPTLQRYDMNFYYPTAGGTALKWFYQTSPLIYQFGGSLYTPDGLGTTINEEASVKGLQLLGDLYTTYSLPEQVAVFYNSFRYNKLPVGIIDFTTYLQLKYAAPELTGQWALAPYPGIYNEETESVDRWYIGNGTGGVMFEDSDDPIGAWGFMKWWTSAETQSQFAYTLQSTYGPEFLWLSSNLEAVANSPIDNVDKQVILEQIKWLRDVPRTPGQYMLERGLSNIWNTVTFDGTPVRVAIDKEVILINREMKRKLVEFGYLDSEGNVLKPYIIRDVDWIQFKMDEAKDGDN